MLERASTCLESGGRQLLRAPKPCLRTRRMLHSTFWHHGASDLSLPSWWAASQILDIRSGDVNDGAAKTTTSTFSVSHDGALLDFLYPEKTLALLKRLSVSPIERPEARRRQFRGINVRQYSTAPWQPSIENPGMDEAEVREAKREAQEMLQGKHAIQVLPKFLRDPPAGKQQLAWQLYEAIPEAHLARGHWKTRTDLLQYLTIEDNSPLPNQVLQIFEKIPHAQRRPSSYRAAIVAYISLRMVGPAIQLLERIVPRDDYNLLQMGTDVILKRTVLDEQWDLSLKVFRILLHRQPIVKKRPVATSLREGNTLPEVWKGVAQLSDLRALLRSFWRYCGEFQNELRSNPENLKALSAFATTFVPHVIDQAFDQEKSNDRDMNKFLRSLFRWLTIYQIPSSLPYEQAILRTLEMPRYEFYGERQPLWLDTLYDQYRNICLGSPPGKHRMKPSRRLLRALIIHYSQHNMLQEIDSLVQDLRTFYPDQGLTIGLLKDLVHVYAESGDAAHVEEYIAELKRADENELSIYVLSALPFAYARRADVEGTIAQFSRIQDDYGLAPDTACWNILLLAYVRANDLDGALEVYNACLDNDVSLDKYSFNTLLMLCADRGDVEAFEALFSRAKQMGVSLTGDVRARSGYVQAFLNAGDFDGAYAIAQGMLQSWKAGTLRGHPLTHTWNLLIQHHALDRDIVGARARYKEMVQNKIPIDTWTYGGLMRALVEVKQSSAAYHLLRKTMPAIGLRVHALHYAICMTGLLREGGGNLQLALDAWKHMNERGIPQTESSVEASIRMLGEADSRRLEKLGAKNPERRLKRAHKLLETILVESAQMLNASRQPTHFKSIGAPGHSLPQHYYGLLISLYSKRRADKVIKKLLKKAELMAPDSGNYSTPMALIEANMEYYLTTENHVEVARYWHMARKTADKLTRLALPTTQPPKSTEVDVLDESIIDTWDKARISNNHRHILVKASRIYIRSLLAASNLNANALAQVQRTMHDLLIHGYNLDNLSWNEFVIALALNNRLLDAFTICETFLIPGFPGWRELHPTYIRKDQQGYRWMNMRHFDLKNSSILPRYNTLVVLAAAMRKMRLDEREGIGYDKGRGLWLRELVNHRASRTVRAIESMPRTGDKIQMRLLHSRE